MYSVAIYYTGAQHSWIFFLPLFRVVDQTTTSFKRALAFAHLAPLSYAFVILYVVLVRAPGRRGGRRRSSKIVFIYFGSLYIAMIARTGDERHARSSEIIRLARGLIHELEEKSKALERSSRQLHDALDQQADLHKENARLFGATEAREARLSQILHSTSDGIIFVGQDGRIEAANVRAGDLLGFDPQTVIGMDVMRILARLYSLGDGDSFGVTLKALLADPGPGGARRPAAAGDRARLPLGGAADARQPPAARSASPSRSRTSRRRATWCASSKTSRACSTRRAARPKKPTAPRESSSPTSRTRCARRSARSSAWPRC